MLSNKIGKWSMKWLTLISELSHISEKKNDSMRWKKWSKWKNSFGNALISTVIAPIYDRRMSVSLDESRSSLFWDEEWWYLWYMQRILSEEVCDTIEWESIFYLKFSESRKRKEIIFLFHVYSCSNSVNTTVKMRSIDIWHTSTSIKKCIFFYIWSQGFMDDKSRSIFGKEKFFISIFLKGSKLFEVVGCDDREDSNIWCNNICEKRHLTRMVDTVFEDEISRIWSHETIESDENKGNP